MAINVHVQENGFRYDELFGAQAAPLGPLLLVYFPRKNS
jgi:hypothetical protein